MIPSAFDQWEAVMNDWGKLCSDACGRVLADAHVTYSLKGAFVCLAHSLASIGSTYTYICLSISLPTYVCICIYYHINCLDRCNNIVVVFCLIIVFITIAGNHMVDAILTVSEMMAIGFDLPKDSFRRCAAFMCTHTHHIYRYRYRGQVCKIITINNIKPQ